MNIIYCVVEKKEGVGGFPMRYKTRVHPTVELAIEDHKKTEKLLFDKPYSWAEIEVVYEGD